MPKEYKKRIVVDPKIMVGKPVIAGTRVPVDLILRKLAQGMRVKEILRDYPRLTGEDIKAAMWYAAETVAQENVYTLERA